MPGHPHPGSLVRPARLPGVCYPADPDELRAWLDGFLNDAGPALPTASDPLPAMALPHIDPRGGGPTYGRGYRVLRTAASDLFVILGIGHAGLQYGVSLCPASFATPLGLLPVDLDLVAELVGRCGSWLLADQQVQETEHSIELQAVFLRHVFERPVAILPLLMGFGGGPPPRHVVRFLEVLREVLRASRRKVTVIASVDFSHVGPMYGDAHGAAQAMERVREQDLGAIAHLQSPDPDAFWEHVEGAGNPTRICGVSALWSMLEVVQPQAGQLLDYAETSISPTHGPSGPTSRLSGTEGAMDARDSRVTFASLSFR